MNEQRVAIVAGARTPFVKAGQAFATLGPLALAKHAVRGLLERHEVDPAGIDAMAFGVVVPEPGKPNIARGRMSAGIAGGVEWLSGADPATFREPTTGLSMGEHMELTRAEWNIPRERQDEVALASHRNAVAARERLAQEIVPVEGVEHDTGPRPDTSLER